MIRIAIPIWLLTASLASAQETTVRFTILGRDGAEEVEIGPEGGLVPYRLSMETDPLGTPGNFGLFIVSITIDTDLGVPQAPVTAFDASFKEAFRVFHKGVLIEPDDIAGITGGPNCFRGRRGPCVRSTGIAQTGPLRVAIGSLRVAPAPVGSTFHAHIRLEVTATLSPTLAKIVLTEDFVEVRPPDRLVANALRIHVVEEPPLPGDFDRDGDVDLADFLLSAQCLEDPEQPLTEHCLVADLDWDGDVDLADVVSLMGMYTGGN